ncbi:hypothetical protein EV702DRAFT_1046305 [Suillus placidus]|uniref:Uncharacterized protein n=1 Tax=Suillus placidus TaxID=48579 RepID=A0A9P6ZTV1_9AGAM|nr:hypothetical protein EV702DRAFT_1046305 [Suillus placidus]
MYKEKTKIACRSSENDPIQLDEDSHSDDYNPVVPRGSQLLMSHRVLFIPVINHAASSMPAKYFDGSNLKEIPNDFTLKDNAYYIRQTSNQDRLNIDMLLICHIRPANISGTETVNFLSMRGAKGSHLKAVCNMMQSPLEVAVSTSEMHKFSIIRSVWLMVHPSKQSNIYKTVDLSIFLVSTIIVGVVTWLLGLPTSNTASQASLELHTIVKPMLDKGSNKKAKKFLLGQAFI